MKKSNGPGEITLDVNIRVRISFWTSLKMRLMGRYPAAILARAIADKIREAK